MFSAPFFEAGPSEGVSGPNAARKWAKMNENKDIVYFVSCVCAIEYNPAKAFVIKVA